MRPGAFALSLLSVPLNIHVLEALEGEPRSLRDLRQAAGVPAPTTIRKQLRTLADLGLVIRFQQTGFSGGVGYELGPPAAGLLEVGRLLRDWLADSPEGPLILGDGAAKSTVRALLEAWNSQIVRAIAVRPLSLTDLNALISDLNYPSLERRLSALRFCGLVESRPGENRSTPYGPTHWLRRACGPLMAAAQWERQHAVAEVAAERFDFETVFLLAALGRSFSDEVSGKCRLGIELRNGSGEVTLVGVQVHLVEGEVLSWAGRPEGDADASACGSSVAWVRALIDGRPDDLYLSGDRRLAREVIEGQHRELFPARQPA